jgi:hypothetical protein
MKAERKTFDWVQVGLDMVTSANCKSTLCLGLAG